MRGHDGAFELLAAATGMHARTALVAIFLVCFLCALAVGGLRKAVDPDALAYDSMRWALASRTLGIAMAVMLAVSALVGLRVLPDSTDRWTLTVIDFATLLIGLATPFLAWNHRTLAAQRLRAWWTPAWPGWVMASGIVVVPLLSVLVAIGVDPIVDSEFPLPMRAGVFALGEVLSALLWLAFAVAWLNAGRWRAIGDDLQRVVRWRVLRMLVWQVLVATLVLIALALPIVLGIFVIPQYETWAQSHGQALSPALQSVAYLARWASDTAMPIIGLLWIYPVFAQARLLVKCSVGTSRPLT